MALKSSALAKQIAQLTLTKKASDVVIMDLRTLSPVTDYFVICSADSDVQARAIAGAVEEGMAEMGETVWHRETGSSNWAILDYVDVVVHIFLRTARTFYNLEKLWGDAKIAAVEDTAKPAPAKAAAPVGGGARKPAAKVAGAKVASARLPGVRKPVLKVAGTRKPAPRRAGPAKPAASRTRPGRTAPKAPRRKAAPAKAAGRRTTKKK